MILVRQLKFQTNLN